MIYHSNTRHADASEACQNNEDYAEEVYKKGTSKQVDFFLRTGQSIQLSYQKVVVVIFESV